MVALWVRSYHGDDLLELKRATTAGRTWKGYAVDVGSSDGIAGIAYHSAQIPLFPNNDAPTVHWTLKATHERLDPFRPPRWSSWSSGGVWHWSGNFFVHRYQFQRFNEGYRDFAIGIPQWLLVLGLACFSLLATRYSRSLKHRNDICSKCGYDLRATQDRCPECGAIPKNAQKKGGA